MKIKDLRMDKPFKGLFPIEQDTIEAIAQDMKVNGYDLSHPVVVWLGQNIVIDGNTRILAAKLAGLETVPVDTKDFKDEHEALQYAIHNQRDRRNLTDADLLRWIELVDGKKQRGGDRKSKEAKSKGSSEPIDSAKETAKIVGTSETKVKKARTIFDHADEEIKQEVLEGKKSIHKVAQEVREKRKEAQEKQEEKDKSSLTIAAQQRNYKRRHGEEIYVATPFDKSVAKMQKAVREARLSGWEGISKAAAISSIFQIVQEASEGEDKIAAIRTMGQAMVELDPLLREVKSNINYYDKHPPKKEDKAKELANILDVFFSWAEAWQGELAGILTARGKAETNS